MFSGIVEEAATVVALNRERENLHITLRCSFAAELKIDQSVSHNGVTGRGYLYRDGYPGDTGTVEPGPAGDRKQSEPGAQHAS